MTKRKDVYKSDIERFVKFIELSNSGCWNWTGAIDQGRCIFSIKNKNTKAQNFMYTKEVPSGMIVFPECGNNRCVNPDHLSVRPFKKTAIGLRGSPIDRFMAKVSVSENGCWDWTGAISNGGYGAFNPDGKIVRPHRWIYEYYNGELPDKIECDHLCRNRKCVNPAHIEPVTKLENVRRGESGKWQRDKTHCPHGHEYTEKNTMWTIYKHKNGTNYDARVCRKCQEIKRNKPENREKHKEYLKEWYKLRRQKSL